MGLSDRIKLIENSLDQKIQRYIGNVYLKLKLTLVLNIVYTLIP